MLLKIVKTTAIAALTVSALNAADFNAQAEKDRLELIKYFEAKFEDPLKNKYTFFPYSTNEELEAYEKGLKAEEFALGSYSYNADGKSQYEEIKEMPPYEDGIDKGAKLYETKFANGNSLQTCFPEPAVTANYPYYDEKRAQVVTLTQAVNECLTSNGEKAWGMKKGKIKITSTIKMTGTNLKLQREQKEFSLKRKGEGEELEGSAGWATPPTRRNSSNSPRRRLKPRRVPKRRRPASSSTAPRRWLARRTRSPRWPPRAPSTPPRTRSAPSSPCSLPRTARCTRRPPRPRRRPRPR